MEQKFPPYFSEIKIQEELPAGRIGGKNIFSYLLIPVLLDSVFGKFAFNRIMIFIQRIR